MTARPTTPNVLAIYAMATDAEREHGRRWYADAMAAAESLNPDNPRQAAGIIAALSPRMPWARNLELAARTYADGKASGTMTSNTGKADRILGGESPEAVLSGAKVRAFYGAIVGDAESVVIDRHAFDIAVGKVTDDATRAALGRKGEYARYARTYVRAARTLGIPASQVQATTWVVWRRLKGIAD